MLLFTSSLISYLITTLIIFTTIELISILLIAVLLLIGFRILRGGAHGPVSKPHVWEESVANNTIARSLQNIEGRYRDKIRFYTFWFQINRLRREKVKGAFAELGVYRGETAKIIHAMDDTRKLYLFDTFEGFSSRDLADESLTAENKAIDFSNTSVERVRDYIQGNENLIFIKGYFPDEAPEVDEPFALVSIDADLYAPTLAGLRFFYPRLAPGGVIIVHDYNHTWSGVRRAVDEFAPHIPENLIEVADWQGSVMIIRNKKGPA